MLFRPEDRPQGAEELPVNQAALIEPMACAIHAVQRAEIQPATWW